MSSVACVVAAKTGEASRTADNAIIVFFIISSFNVIGYERDSACHRRSEAALGKNCKKGDAMTGLLFPGQQK